MSTVSLVQTDNRAEGAAAAIDALGVNPVRNKAVLIKPNFNTADAAPGSTHNDTLAALIDHLWGMGAGSIALGERSYPVTRRVMEEKGVLPLLAEKQVRVIDFDDLEESDWIECNLPGSHWKNGFRVARPVLEAECLVSTGCLKTHQFGGVITLSLKLHVGVVPTGRNGFPYMRELHGSAHQQEMIAEINTPFSPALVVMDGVEAFVDGGPATGRRAAANVFLASADRVAVDAVGVAVLKDLGSNPDIMGPKIFEQRQIRRAAELGLGVSSVEDIELRSANAAGQDCRDRIDRILKNG
jgi:uncharacterized protein (DUF362 family)